MIQLFNVIEINPFKYFKEDDEIPELSDSPSAKDLDERWRKTVSTVGLNLKPIQEGSHFVDIETVDDENLKIILKIIFKNVETEDEGYLMFFNGGLILKKDGEILLEPTCCVDLADLKEWEYIFENNSSEWSQLWIGHPYVFYRRHEGKVQFSDYTDCLLTELKNIQSVFEVDESDLKVETNKIKTRQLYFNNRVSKLLKEI